MAADIAGIRYAAGVHIGRRILQAGMASEPYRQQGQRVSLPLIFGTVKLMSEANNNHPQNAGEQNGYQGTQQGASYGQPSTQQGYAYQQQPGTGPQPGQSGSPAYTGSGNSGTYNSNSYGPQGIPPMMRI